MKTEDIHFWIFCIISFPFSILGVVLILKDELLFGVLAVITALMAYVGLRVESNAKRLRR